MELRITSLLLFFTVCIMLSVYPQAELPTIRFYKNNELIQLSDSNLNVRISLKKKAMLLCVRYKPVKFDVKLKYKYLLQTDSISVVLRPEVPKGYSVGRVKTYDGKAHSILGAAIIWKSKEGIPSSVYLYSYYKYFIEEKDEK